MNKIVVNGVAYDATPVEAAQEGQRTVVVDGVTYAITPAAAPSASVVGNIEKINVNGQLYDIRDVEDVNAISHRIDTILAQLGDGTIPVGLALLANKVKSGAITIEMLQGNLQETNKVADNLTTDNTLNPLSARQGKILKELIDVINGNGEGSTNKKINDAITEFATKLTDNDSIDTFKEIMQWVAEHGKEFTDVVKYVNKIEDNAAQYDSLSVTAMEDSVDIFLDKIHEEGVPAESHTVTIPAATTESAGVMSAADKITLDAVVNNVSSLTVKKFYTLPTPAEIDNEYQKIEKVSLNILGQYEDYFRCQVKNSGVLERSFYARDYGVMPTVPVHFVSYVYSEKEQETFYQLYEGNVGYLQSFKVHLKIGWNKLELEHTFEIVTQNMLTFYLGKGANNDFYFYKTFVYNSITKAPIVSEHTTSELNNRLVETKNVVDTLQANFEDTVIYDNEDVVFKGNGKTYNVITYSTPVAAGDVFVIKLDGITKPADSLDKSYLRLQFYDVNNNQITQQFFYSSDTPVNTEIVIPDGCVKLNYLFGLSVGKPSVLDGEYKWSGLTFKRLNHNDVRFRNVETRVTELETLSNDWNGKVLTTYGDSVTALQGGDFSYPYDLTNTQKWGNRVAGYFKMSKHYGRGVGGQKYAWGTNGGAVTWVYKDTGIMINRNDAFNLDSWDGSSFPSTWTDAQKNTILNGLADGSVISIRGCACSWLRITSMYPASIKDSIDVVFVMFHNDSVDGNEFAWVEGDTTDPEWAASSYYSTYGGDYNISTLEGGIVSTIMKLQAWMPNAVIILGTPINGQGTTGQLRPDANGLYKQVQHVKNVGLRFSIPVIDVYATCGINGLNRTEYITDGIHPYSVAGSKMVARAIIGGFKTILPNL